MKQTIIVLTWDYLRELSKYFIPVNHLLLARKIRVAAKYRGEGSFVY